MGEHTQRTRWKVASHYESWAAQRDCKVVCWQLTNEEGQTRRMVAITREEASRPLPRIVEEACDTNGADCARPPALLRTLQRALQIDR